MANVKLTAVCFAHPRGSVFAGIHFPQKVATTAVVTETEAEFIKSRSDRVTVTSAEPTDEPLTSKLARRNDPRPQAVREKPKAPPIDPAIQSQIDALNAQLRAQMEANRAQIAELVKSGAIKPAGDGKAQNGLKESAK